MAALDGGIRALFGAAFAGLYLDATLHRSTRTLATDGDVGETGPADEAVKAHFDELTETMRAAPGYTEDDVAILILAEGVSAKPTTDDEITLEGERWAIRAPIQSDPAQSYWLCRGQRTEAP